MNGHRRRRSTRRSRRSRTDRHRPAAAQHPSRPLRAGHVRAHRGRRAHHGHRDLARARPGQLLQRMMWLPVALTPGIAVAGAAGVVLAAGPPRPSCPCAVGGGRRQQPAGSVPPPAGHRAAARRLALARYNAEMGPPTFAPLLFGLVGGMGLAGRRSCDGRTERSGTTPGTAEQRFPGYDVVGASPTSGTAPRPAGGARPAGAAGPAQVLHGRGGGRPSGPSSTGSWPRTTSRGCPVFEIGRPAPGRGPRRGRLPLRRPARGRRSLAASRLLRSMRTHWRVPARASPRSSHLAQLRHHRAGPLCDGEWHGPPGRPRVLALDAVRLQRLLLPPLGVERDRLRRPGLPDGVTRTSGLDRPRALGGPRTRRRRPGALGAASRGGQKAPRGTDSRSTAEESG